MRILSLFTKPGLLKWGAVLIILAVSLLAFYKILALPFTGTDTLTLIDTSRIRSSRDALRIITQPMMAGTTFTDQLTYYRPMSVLSFSLDYLLWGLNPVGYHRTDLLLHLASTLLFFVLLERLSGGRTMFACLAALLFTLHPLLSQSLPVISRRQDLLVAFFSLLAMLFFGQALGTSGRGKTLQKSLAVLFCVFAMASKETGFLTPVFIFAWAIVFTEDTEKRLRVRAVYALRASGVYLLAAVVMFVIRTSLLGGIGFNLFGSTQASPGAAIGTTLNYFNSLIDPGEAIYGFLKAVFTPAPSALPMAGSVVALGLLFIYLIRVRATMRDWIANLPGRVTRGAVRMLLVLLLLSLLVLLSYPLLAPILGKVIEDAYEGRGLRFIVDTMQGRDRTPVESYLLRARNYAVGTSYLVLLYAWLSLSWLAFFVIRIGEDSDDWQRLMVLLMLWLWLPLGLFIFTASASQRSMYFSAALFSAILSAIFVRGLTELQHRLRREETPPTITMPSIPRFLHIGTVLLVILITCSQILRGPLFRSFTKWEQNGKLSSEFFDALSHELSGLPDNARLIVYGLPPVTESSIMDYTVKSWLDLVLPGNEMSVEIADRVDQAGCESCLQLRIEPRAGRRYELYVEFQMEVDA